MRDLIGATGVDDQVLADVSERGFGIIAGAVPPPELDDMRLQLEAAIAEDLVRWSGNPHYRDANMVMNLMTRGSAFVRYLENPVLRSYASALLGETCIVYAYTSSSMPAGGTNYSRRIHVDAPRWIPGYATNIGFTLAVDSFTAENGAISFLPGSHLVADAPDEVTFEAGAEQVLLNAGDLVVFNARTFHRGGQNRTAAPRHAVTMNVCRSYMRQQFDFPRLVSPDVAAALSPGGRTFLGFDVRMPVSLEEYYVPDEQRLYKAGQG